VCKSDIKVEGWRTNKIEPEAWFPAATGCRFTANPFVVREERASRGGAVEVDDLLRPVFDWFTEGFDTKELKKARAALVELDQDTRS
jgi:hypothetical protein